MKQTILNNLKNLYGWRTKRKIVVISVDDYGSIRLDSKKARSNLDKAGLKVITRFDAFDTLENREDLEMLFDTLSSVKDKNGNNAIFTPFALPCNINFEAVIKKGYRSYIYETLSETYNKLSEKNPKAYKGTWKLWKEGIDKKLMKPQFHGREHLNISLFNELLDKKDKQVFINIENRSYTSIDVSNYKGADFTEAFQFWDLSENKEFKNIIKDGLDKFEEVYGYRSVHFNAPGKREHPMIHSFLFNEGIRFLDAALVERINQGQGKYKKVFNYTGKKNNIGMITQVRNVVFEPTEDRGIDWVNYSLKQIEAAFRWNRPAIISSHRVNFCGHIDPKNRETGITALKELLKKIVQKWPEVEFMSSEELGELMEQG